MNSTKHSAKSSKEEIKNRVIELYINEKEKVFFQGTISNPRDVKQHIDALNSGNFGKWWIQEKVRGRVLRNSNVLDSRENWISTTDHGDWKWKGFVKSCDSSQAQEFKRDNKKWALSRGYKLPEKMSKSAAMALWCSP